MEIAGKVYLPAREEKMSVVGVLQTWAGFAAGQRSDSLTNSVLLIALGRVHRAVTQLTTQLLSICESRAPTPTPMQGCRGGYWMS